MTNEFRELINEYMYKCDTEIENNDNFTAKILQEDVRTIFEEFIPNIDNSLDRSSIYSNSRVVDYVGNIKKLRHKLRVLLITEGKYSLNTAEKEIVEKVVFNNKNEIKDSANSSVSGSGNSTNTNTNTLTNTVDINAELSKVREQVEADEMLGDDDKVEINERLDEIEAIMGDSPSNNEKWKKLKDVVNWVTTKGYKVGQMIMPLVTKALFPEQAQ